MSYKAFVSSTFIDLKEHRAHVIDALRKAGIQVDPMEEWSADSDEPKHLTVERMRDCDLCILLVGARRGHIPDNEILSITQMEVKEAVKLGIEVIPFLYDGEGPWLPAHYELDKDENLKKWRAELQEHRCVRMFTHNPLSLDNPVRDAVSRWIQKQSWPEVQKTYLELLRDAHASIRFLGVGHYKDLQDQPIENLFVDPCTSSQRISPDTPPENWPETTALLELLSSEKNLVLLGDPGSGKSTLVSWIVWNLARSGDNKWKKVLNHRIPFVMVLRDMSLDQVRSWDDLLASYFKHWTARHLGQPRYASDVSELLERGQAMIILDGLDEVGSPKVQKNLRQAVWEGIRRYKECGWLLTSRVVGYLDYHEERDPEAQGGGGNAIFSYAQLRYVAPFADHQIKKFVQNWFTTRDQSTIRASEDANRLEEAIHTNPYTLRLARIPNLLMMMALIHRERARLPHGRALLYKDIANAYLQSIDEHRRIEHLGYSLRDQKQWLGRIGFEMQMRRHRTESEQGKAEEKEILVEGKEVREWVISAMRDAGRKECNEEAANAFLDEICRRSGLLLPRGEDQFAFTHLSFQEFFAAVFFIHQFVLPPQHIKSRVVSGAGGEDLHAYAGNQMWHETLFFLVELMFAEHTEWLENLLFCLFGDDFNEIVPRPGIGTMNNEPDDEDDPTINKAILLARLTVNPHAGFAEHNLKFNAIARCCDFEAGEQKRTEEYQEHTWLWKSYISEHRTFRALLGTDQNEISHVWMAFKDAIRKADVKVLSLSNLSIGTAAWLADVTCLRKLDLSMTDVVDLSPLSALRDLEWLLLRHTNVSEVRALTGLTKLKWLELAWTPTNDMSPLTGCTNLHGLNLWNTIISNISPLAALTNLQELDLMDTKVIDIRQLAELTEIRKLNLRRTDVRDFAPLARLSSLQELDLEETQINDLRPLTALTSLQVLSLKGTQVTDVSPLAALTSLQILDLSATKIIDIRPLTTITGLQNLNLSSTVVSDISPLTTITGLQILNLSYTMVSDVRPLTGLTKLQVLYLHSTKVSEDDVRVLRDALPECNIITK